MKHFLSITDFSPQELQNLLELATNTEGGVARRGDQPRLHEKNLALIFQKPSLRTRVSFEMGVVHLLAS